MKVSLGVRSAFASLDGGSSLALPSPRTHVLAHTERRSSVSVRSAFASLDGGSSLALPSPRTHVFTHAGREASRGG